jgi:Asp-tRNA(Asn)/Glu-tRNA(Gln) amidotransferase A subunit family amidase
MSTHGPHAGSIEDMWQVAIEIASRTGGDPGHTGLMGPMTTPLPVMPQRLIVLETEGWAKTDDASKAVFAKLMESLERAGITLIRRTQNSLLENLETSIADATHVCGMITAWENRWNYRNVLDRHPDGISERLQQTLASAEAMTPDDYRDLVLRRELARVNHAAIAPLGDAAITFACPGPATPWPGDAPGEPLAPRPTGDAVYNYPSSMLGAPVVTVPLMGVGGLPVGLQIMGQRGEDARITAIARWLLENISPVTG